MGYKGIQSVYSIRQDVVAGVLGAHRVCLRAAVDFAEARKQHYFSDAWPGVDICGDAGNFDLADEGTNSRGSQIEDGYDTEFE
jgi:hypothetical protein